MRGEGRNGQDGGRKNDEANIKCLKDVMRSRDEKVIGKLGHKTGYRWQSGSQHKKRQRQSRETDAGECENT